mgnify:CR=1 FL=1
MAETFDQGRDVMVMGDSGILACCPPDRRPVWEAGRRRLVWPNGATAQVYSAHEPEALKEGVSQNVIDVIKYRRSTEGLDETDALIIELGRQLWRDHKVKPETFAKLKTIFGPNKLVELVMLMGNYAGTAALRNINNRLIKEN